jgi:hypothetical protein
MIMDVEIGLKFIESRTTVDDVASIYGFTIPGVNFAEKNKVIAGGTANYLNIK